MVRFLIIWLSAITLVLAEHSPVFLWGANSPIAPALHTLSKKEFAAIIEPMLKDHMIVAFEEKSLFSGDFLCANDHNFQSCYSHLQAVPQKNYYASVESPGEALRSLSSVNIENNVLNNDGNLESPLICNPGNVVFVSFNDNKDERRETLLERHDAAIYAVSKQVDCPVIYLYMSASSAETTTQVRVRRAANEGYVFRQGSQFLVFFKTLHLKKSNNVEEIKVRSMDVSKPNLNMFGVSLATEDGKAVTFDIKLSGGYFSMINVAYDNILFHNSSMDAPTEFSYYCGNATLTSSNSNAKLIWNSLQFQAPYGKTNNTNFKFGDAWHCVGFFSPGILSGLFVVALLLSITFTGICWMMDINTMDRFDDPKGKTITINASE